jgi:type II secretion system protein G
MRLVHQKMNAYFRQKISNSGFTLIELLIVVAIISILASIALPNFQQAQVRAKVARVESELRTLGNMLEVYRTDNSSYPPENYQSDLLVLVYGTTNTFAIPDAIKLKPLTTPIAYISRLPADPFDPGNDSINQIQPHTYHYASNNDLLYPGSAFFDGNNEEGRRCEWILQSYGPDHGLDLGLHTYWQFPRYDPTNGTISLGNVLLMGP